MSALERQIAALQPQRAFPRPVHLPAPRTVALEPAQFVESWEQRPNEVVEVGIFVPSEHDMQGARIEAAKIAREKPVDDEERNDVFNDALMTICVARSLCAVDNVKAPHPLFPDAEEILPHALKPRTIKRLFDEVERLHVDQSPIFEEATENDVHDLVEILCKDDPFEGVAPLKAAQARRYLRFSLELLEH